MICRALDRPTNGYESRITFVCRTGQATTCAARVGHGGCPGRSTGRHILRLKKVWMQPCPGISATNPGSFRRGARLSRGTWGPADDGAWITQRPGALAGGTRSRRTDDGGRRTSSFCRSTTADDPPLSYFGADAGRHSRNSGYFDAARLPLYRDILGDGAAFGVRLFASERHRRDCGGGVRDRSRLYHGHPCALVLGDNLFFGQDSSTT